MPQHCEVYFSLNWRIVDIRARVITLWMHQSFVRLYWINNIFKLYICNIKSVCFPTMGKLLVSRLQLIGLTNVDLKKWIKNKNKWESNKIYKKINKKILYCTVFFLIQILCINTGIWILIFHVFKMRSEVPAIHSGMVWPKMAAL